MASPRMRIWTLCLLLGEFSRRRAMPKRSAGRKRWRGSPGSEPRRRPASTCSRSMERGTDRARPDRVRDREGRVRRGHRRVDRRARRGRQAGEPARAERQARTGRLGAEAVLRRGCRAVAAGRGTQGHDRRHRQGRDRAGSQGISEGVAALYNNHRKDKALTRQTIQTQLEAAKWPDFGEVKAAR